MVIMRTITRKINILAKKHQIIGQNIKKITTEKVLNYKNFILKFEFRTI